MWDPSLYATSSSIGPALPGPSDAEVKRQNQAYASGTAEKREGTEKKKLRMAGGKVWEDATLEEWPEDDYRIFVGDLGNEVTDDLLQRAFAHYNSVAKVKVVRDKITGKSKGFGFVSMMDPMEFLKALKEMNGSYIGNRPVKIKKSNWKRRDLEERKKESFDYTVNLIRTQYKGTGTSQKKRKPRPENANRDTLRHKKPATGPATRWTE